jgi:phosphoserine aminotransferase
MIKIGKDRIVRETNYKSALLYNTIQNHNLLSEYIKDKSIQSKTVIVSKTKKESKYFIESLKNKNLIIGNGYGSIQNQIRIANFPSHSKESVELLCDELTKL